jgi:putative ABC transport system substrate-binding protein
MRRRTFITGLGSAAAWPLAARAQQAERMRRIGVLMAFDESDSDGKAQLSAFIRGLAELGWTEGRNAQMDVRWAAGDVDRTRSFAKELVGLRPDVILGSTTALIAALQRETRTIPIVFAGCSDPIGAGLVASLSRPGGNITGFSYVEAEMAGKWLELLTEIAPAVIRVAIIFNPDTAARGGSYYTPSFEAAARALNLDPIIARVHGDAEIETVINSLARTPGSGLVIMPDVFTLAHRATIILLAARNNVPAVYTDNAFGRGGGFLSYGPDMVDIFRRSASYVARILRGEMPADLAVQLPVKFDTIVNLKIAKALGLTVPQTILLRADEVIE